jgi:hypothetical protein
MKTQQTLKELESASCSYIREHWENGGSSEFDTSINDISRAKIKAFHKLHGKIWLVKVNRYNAKEKSEPLLIPYWRQKIYNFSYSLAVPKYDLSLINLLQEYEKPLPGGYNGKIRMQQIEEIMNQADQLGCIFLQWS